MNALLAERGLPLCQEAADACLACRDPGLPNDGVSWVHLDAADNPATVYANRIAPDYNCGRSCNRQKIDGTAREGVLDLLRRFGDLTFETAGVICGMLGGKTLTELASETGKSVQVLHARWKMACAADPIWKSIENGMIGKGIGRKPGRTRTFDEEASENPTQGELELR